MAEGVTPTELGRLTAAEFHALLPPAQHPAIQNARETLELEDRVRTINRTDPARRLLRAVRISPTIHVCEALLRGEPVPPSRLDRRWVKAYGRRHR